MTYFLKVKSLGWPSEGPMVLPLILSLRFLIKEKEKKRAHRRVLNLSFHFLSREKG